MTNGYTPTPQQNAESIAQLTAAVDMLVTQFIRPNAQQANANRETLNEILELLNRHAQAIVDIDERLQTNTQQIAAIGDRLEQLEARIDDTRQLVAKNASDIAQLTVKHDNFIDRLDNRLDRLSGEVQAVAETSRTQLAGILANGRRIDRLEQQAS